MRNTLAIAAKEARVYLTTPIAYVLAGCFMLLTAMFFRALVVDFQDQRARYGDQPWALEQLNLTDWVLGPLFMNIGVILLIVLPMLTMRLLSEERRTKTLDFLFTTPVRPLEMVLGKYLAAVVMVFMMLGLTLVFPLLLQILGAAPGASPLDWNTVLSGYLGVLLMAAGMVAIGLLMSALTESQIIAAVLSFVVLILFWLMSMAGRGETGLANAFFSYVSLTSHLENFLRGIIRVSDLVYFVSLVFFGLFVTHRVIEAHRWR